AKKVDNELIILPNIKPTNGINMASLNLIFSSIFIKTNVQTSAKAKDTSIFCNGFAAVKNMRETSTQSLAESSVPEVVGEKNLFLLSCCIINPQILMLMPATRILNSLGSLLMSKISAWSSVNRKISSGDTSETPMKIDATDKTISAMTKYRIFIKCPSQLFII